MSSAWALQEAVYAALAADPGVKALLGDPARIYDDAPIDAIFPFLAIGQARHDDWPGAPNGAVHALSLHAWSRYAGRKEIKDIMAAVYAVLHDQSLSVYGFHLVNMRFVFADVFRKQDGDTYQGLMRYRAVTEPI
ncbi:MAG: DUF3168 domain-containing protein [Pseudomonadota bacterium]